METKEYCLIGCSIISPGHVDDTLVACWLLTVGEVPDFKQV